MFRFHNAIAGKKNISVIAEIKRYSPSYDRDFPEYPVTELVAAYEKGGASAISVVTAKQPFKGSLELLREARKLTKLPILRKDFITEARHIDESVDAGADAILLIAKNLSSSALARLVSYAQSRGLDSVVEIHTEEDLAKITGLTGIIVGINNRNLENFKTNVHHAKRLLPKISPEITIIVESAFRETEELSIYKGRIDAVLIGTALLTAPDPYQKLYSFTTRCLTPNA